MDVISWQPYWLLKNGLQHSYPTLKSALKCDAVVVGGGITGALVAHRLVSSGIDTVLIEKDDVGAGSTSGSTALLQYEIDVQLFKLSKKVGFQKAAQAYRSCYQTIDTLEELSAQIGLEKHFIRGESIYVASRQRDIKDLEKEQLARKEAGINVDLISAKELKKKYQCIGHGALVAKQAAQLDPYLFTHQLIYNATRKGLRVFDRTLLKSFQNTLRGVDLKCNGHLVRAKKMIIATGYEANKWLPAGLVKLHSTYACSSKPNLEAARTLGRRIFWESARPYFYARSTPDKRVIFGGLDENFQDHIRRDKLIPVKSKKLMKEFSKKFPSLKLELAYAWAGTFGETSDGLPYIGSIPKYPHSYFACGYGGNGITFSVRAAHIIAADMLGKKHPDAEIFGFQR